MVIIHSKQIQQSQDKIWQMQDAKITSNRTMLGILYTEDIEPLLKSVSML